MRDALLKRILYIVLAVSIGLGGYYCGILQERSGSSAGGYSTQALKIKKLSDLIREHYYFQDDIDEEEAFDYAMAGYVQQLGDPFSGYISKEDLEGFNEEIEGNYIGIGVEITVDDQNFLTIINSFDGSAAQKAGIKTGDRIIKVQDVPVTGDMINEAVKMIRGLPGETVSLEILTKEGEQKNLELIRSEVSVETVRVKMIEDHIGYVRISSFDAETGSEFIRKFDELNLADMKGLIVDLRSNSGGTLDSVLAVADYLMPEGTIVSVKYTDGTETKELSDGEHSVDIPICVLIDEGSASAAELLAGALRDNNKAKLVGMNSYGKGVVGQNFYIDSESAVLLTVGEYFLPSGENIHKVGLKPDIEIAIENHTMSVFLMEPSQDTQLQRAIEELKSNE